MFKIIINFEYKKFIISNKNRTSLKHIIILKYFIILYGVIKQNEQSCAVPSLNQTHTLVKLLKVTDAGTHLEIDTGIQVQPQHTYLFATIFEIIFKKRKKEN